MSEIIAIVGGSGEGKSTSIESLDPSTTFIINVYDKPLPFRGWKSKYTPANPKENVGNYICAEKSQEIVEIIKYVNTKRPEIKQLIVDDAQYIMAHEFMTKATEKGYEKFSIMAQNMWNVLTQARMCRGDLQIVFMFHEEYINENFIPKRKIKTLGNLLDSKITLEGMFTVVLFTKVTKDDKTKQNIYQFVTQTEDGSTAKSPKDMFDLYIPNDLAFVIEKINEYYK